MSLARVDKNGRFRLLNFIQQTEIKYRGQYLIVVDLLGYPCR